MSEEDPTRPVGESVAGAQSRRRGPTLSLIMIVKNEAENLPELLGPLKDKFDEIVVVDTGSDDGTPEVAAAHGARVYHFPWINDFSAARNESIRHATGEWLFWLDGDDRMRPEEVDRIRQLIALHPDRDVAYSCHLRSLGESWSADQNMLQVRLIPNVPGVHFVGEVHERVSDSLRKLGIKLVSGPVEVIHTGYMDESRLPEKYERNYRLMARILEEDPYDVHARYQLVMQLGAMGRRDEAIDHVEVLMGQVLEMTNRYPEGVSRALTLKGVVYRNFGDREVAQQCFQALVDRDPQVGIGYYLLGSVHFERGDWEAMRECLLKAEYYGISVESLPIPLARVYFDIGSMMGVYYQRTGRWIRAAQEFRKALTIQEDYLPYYAEMGDAFYRGKDLQRAWSAYRTGIRVHDRSVERLRARAPERLESGQAKTGTVSELSPKSRQEYLARLYAGMVRVELEQGRTGAARLTLEEAVERLPEASGLAMLSLDLALRTGQWAVAAAASSRVLRLEPDSYPAYEGVVNVHLRYGRLQEAVPLLTDFWRRYPGKWDAALIGVLTALRTGQSASADSLLGEMRDCLAGSGVASAAEWPGTWRPDHPALEFFSDSAHWSGQPTGDPAESSDPEEYGPKREEHARKLVAVCEAISAQLSQMPSQRVVGRQDG